MRRPFILLVAMLLACSRPQPSPDYERARQLWTSLVQARADGAAEDPRADEVLALLDRVPPDSADAAGAAELRARIEGERKARGEERARREKLVAGAGAVQAMPALSAQEPGAARPPAQEAAAAPTGVPLAMGMKLDDFRAAYGKCFEERGAVQLTGADGGAPRPAVLWVMKDDEACKKEHAALAGQAVLFAGGALAGVAPASSARQVESRRQVELGTLPDGGVGIREGGKVVPVPAGATLVLDGGTP
jgi:hypothetical protein